MTKEVLYKLQAQALENVNKAQRSFAQTHANYKHEAKEDLDKAWEALNAIRAEIKKTY